MSLLNESLVQLAVFGFFTGFGTTFGTEIAKALVARGNRWLTKKRMIQS